MLYVCSLLVKVSILIKTFLCNVVYILCGYIPLVIVNSMNLTENRL